MSARKGKMGRTEQSIRTGTLIQKFSVKTENLVREIQEYEEFDELYGDIDFGEPYIPAALARDVLLPQGERNITEFYQISQKVDNESEEEFIKNCGENYKTLYSTAYWYSRDKTFIKETLKECKFRIKVSSIKKVLVGRSVINGL